MRRQLWIACALVGILAVPATGQQGQIPPGIPVDQTAPADLRPLLLPRQSEMRLVVARYTLDRTTLNGNYLGGMRGGGGRGGGPSAAPPMTLSPNQIARLKRFDLDWQAALAKLDSSRLSTVAKTDLEALATTIGSNLNQLDADTAALARLSPLVPFAPAIVQLVEARIRLEDVNPEKAAGVIAVVTKQIGQVAARIEAGLAAGAAPDALRIGKDAATRAAAAVDTLRTSLAEWFTFYNGYDPLLTWWMDLPFKRVDTALQGLATLLREKVAPADLSASTTAEPTVAPIAPAPAPTFASVPNLEELIALPQDEMTAIVQRFRGTTGRGGGGRGAPQPTQSPGGGGQPSPQAAPGLRLGERDRKFYENWLTALKTLNFDALSRNAQVDYLFIKASAQRQIARVGTTLPADPPRKTDGTGIPGAARGRLGLIFDLQDELIPYTPEELISLAEKEFAWCEQEMKQASRQLGLGDDWKGALEKMKDIHPPPGGQPAVIRDLMFEAVEYLRAKDLLTVPAVAAESLHMIMMSPERQLVNPFFLGGSLITVSYPTNTMEYDARMQSMRGNNTPFSHATAFHEMIPGHNLVGYIGARFSGYRPSLGGSSPFYGEGWPLYWELLMYDQGFHDTPEKKIGALFWRMHRCARIIFSLKFHMGEWSPQECIDFLVDRVGFERDNATAEVRRSFQGGYGPLYQAAYLLGGLQLRGLRRELVDTKQLTNKQFHDEILRQGSMPIALLRLVMTNAKLTRDMPIEWRFY